MATRVRSLGLGFSLDVPFRDSNLLLLFVLSFLPSSILFLFCFPSFFVGEAWSSRFTGIFFSLPQMAGRGRGAGNANADMNDLQADGNAALNQAVIGMNAAMQAMQEMMQQQAQMFQ